MPTPRKDLAFPLSKCMDLTDILPLEHENRTVVGYNAMNGQHPARWWEYSMAHKAIGEWSDHDWASGLHDTPRDPLQLCDVGGAGSRFAQSLVALSSEDITLIDPSLPPTSDTGQVRYLRKSVEEYAATAPHGQFDCITAISVIEHLDAVRPFIRACGMLLRTGGLLFLTTDCWNKEGNDVAHFHWMRRRIYNPETMARLATSCRELGFKAFGRNDWTYKGDTCYDYTFASLAQVKR